MIFPKALCIVILISIAWINFSSCCDDKSLNQTAFLNPDKTVLIEWTTNSTHLTMQVTGKTKGWLGVGFSPTGSMKEADIVIGWVADGKPYLQDRHGRPDGNGLPLLDQQEDYTLIHGKENDTHTIYCFVRKLDTCDKEDFKITEGTISVIFAFNNNDPESMDEDAPQYHGENRGTSSQNLMGRRFQKPMDPDVKYYDFRMPNVSIPDGRDTFYWCQFFDMPEDLKKKNHLIGYEPLFTKGQENLMHHLLVYQCIGNNISKILQNATGFECYTPMAPIPYLQCQTASIGWAVGSKGTFYPPNVGFPFANEIDGQAVYYMFDVHYNNPEKKNGLRDSSGLRVYYTPKLREKDGGWLIVAFTVFNPYLVIPPGQKKFVVPAHCAKECLAAKLPKTGIKVFGYILHTHLKGRVVKVRHYRNGTELKPLAMNEHYDFNFQQDQIMEKDVSVLPGDSLTIECTYNSEKTNMTTVGGESTMDEMCMAFLMYYSVIPIARCDSSINPKDVNDIVGIEELYPIKSPIDPPRIKKPDNLNNTLVATYLKSFKWTDKQVQKLQERMLKSKKVPECTGTVGVIDTKGLKSVNYPNATPYKESDSCAGSSS